MSQYPLIVAQYTLDGHATRTEHWSLVALCGSRNTARIFEVVGNTDTFAYRPHDVTSFARSRRLCGGCLVGYIPESHLGWLMDRLRIVSVRRNDPGFDCQTWVISAVNLLRSDGLVFANINEWSIRQELAREMERSETGHDTIEERLFP